MPSRRRAPSPKPQDNATQASVPQGLQVQQRQNATPLAVPGASPVPKERWANGVRLGSSRRSRSTPGQQQQTQASTQQGQQQQVQASGQQQQVQASGQQQQAQASRQQQGQQQQQAQGSAQKQGQQQKKQLSDAQRRQQVEEAAYYRYLQRGGAEGSSESDWYSAERDLSK